ncbi:hypothetical protein ACFOWE_31235 [Planomonospora corallina]|uniref:Uncharacterized protein n=1 Tax=Planomonospora corallina TaxID=1806052 RepID=A0ABV8IIF4_9ACTN
MTASASRSDRARRAARARWNNDPGRATAVTPVRARAASPAEMPYWLKRVDPDGRLPHDERVRRAVNARTDYYAHILQRARAAQHEQGARHEQA